MKQPDRVVRNGLRLAQLSPDLPGIDFCIAPVGGSEAPDWTSVYPVLRDAAWYAYDTYVPLRYPGVTSYVKLARAQEYAVRLVAGEATDCTRALDGASDFDRLELSADGAYTLAVFGLAGRDEGDALKLRGSLLEDVARNDPERAGVRFVHAGLPFGTADFGFVRGDDDDSGDGDARPFRDVPLGSVARGVGELGYVWFDAPLEKKRVALWAAGAERPRLSDSEPNTNVCLGDLRTVFSIGVEGSSNAPQKILVCEDLTQTRPHIAGTISCVARPPLDSVFVGSGGEGDSDVPVLTEEEKPPASLRVLNMSYGSTGVDLCIRKSGEEGFKGAPLLASRGISPVGYAEAAVVDVGYGEYDLRFVPMSLTDCALAPQASEARLWIDARTLLPWIVKAGETASESLPERTFVLLELPRAGRQVRVVALHPAMQMLSLSPIAQFDVFQGCPALLAPGVSERFQDESYLRMSDYSGLFDPTAPYEYPAFGLYACGSEALGFNLGDLLVSLPDYRLREPSGYDLFVGRDPAAPNDPTKALVLACEGATCDRYTP